MSKRCRSEKTAEGDSEGKGPVIGTPAADGVCQQLSVEHPADRIPLPANCSVPDANGSLRTLYYGSHPRILRVPHSADNATAVREITFAAVLKTMLTIRFGSVADVVGS